VLEELAIRGLGVIEEATLPLAPGLTVVTGETGAGKTMVVTALELLLGARGDAGLVRAGCDAAVVSAVVRPAPAEAREWMSDRADPDDEVIVAREIRPGGRGRARIAGQLAPVGALTNLLGAHVEVHAQHEHVRLARPAVQRELLDRAAGAPHGRVLATYHEAYRNWRELEDLRDRAQADAPVS
jgi:DNA repair protein RecN (Recombination protein N)